MNLAVCRVAIAPLRADKSDCSEMVSQVLFGELIKILDTYNNWIYIETHLDKYHGWMDSKQIQFINKDEFETWKANQLVITRNLKIKTNLGTIELTKGAFLHKKNPTTYSIGNLFIKTKHIHKKQSLITFANHFLTPLTYGGGKQITELTVQDLLKLFSEMRELNFQEMLHNKKNMVNLFFLKIEKLAMSLFTQIQRER